MKSYCYRVKITGRECHVVAVETGVKRAGRRGEKRGVKSVQAVEKALRILEVMGESGRPQNLMELSAAVGLNASTLYRLLVTLCRSGFVVYDATEGCYRLSLKTFQIGQAALSSVDLRRDALPVMERLIGKCNETVNLVVLQGREVIFVEQVESTNLLQFRFRVGSRAPAWATGGGKALLAELSDAEVRSLFAGSTLDRFTENTITDLEALLEELSRTRRRGYAVDDEELERGLKCVACAIYDHTGAAAAALTVTGPAGRLTGAYIESELAALVKEHAALISRRLGRLAADGAATGL